MWMKLDEIGSPQEVMHIVTYGMDVLEGALILVISNQTPSITFVPHMYIQISEEGPELASG